MAKKQSKKAKRRGARKAVAAKSAREADHVEVIARGLIRAGSWILLCRNVKHGYFYLPGGHIEPGEGAGEAVCREVLEETGIKAKPGECLAVMEVRFRQGKRGRHELNVVFEVVPIGPKGGVFHVEHPLEGSPRPIRSLEDGIEFEWVDGAAIVDVDLRPLVLKAWLMSGGRVAGGEGGVAWMAVSEA